MVATPLGVGQAGLCGDGAEGSVGHVERVARNPEAPQPSVMCWGPTCLVLSPTL